MICSMRIKSLIVISFAACLFLALATSGAISAEEEATQTEKKAVEEEFTYSPVGLRDPFAPLVQKIKKTQTRPKRDLGPLEKFELSQFRLMAMLIIDGSPHAMVKAPDGKSYTVKIGDLIGPNSGVVKRIETKSVVLDKETGMRVEKSPDRIVIEEIGIDNFTGKEFKEERYIEM